MWTLHTDKWLRVAWQLDTLTTSYLKFWRRRVNHLRPHSCSSKHQRQLLIPAVQGRHCVAAPPPFYLEWDIGKWDIGKWDIGKWDIGKWYISKCLRGDRTFLLSWKRDILSSIGRILYSGIRTYGTWKTRLAILWDPEHLSSEALGFVLWDRAIWRLRYNLKNPLPAV